MMRTKSEELSQFKSLTLELVELSKIEDLSVESKNVIKDLTIALKYQIEYSIMNEILKESESVKELVPTIDERIMYTIPYAGGVAVGAHTVLKSKSAIPTLLRLSVPFINI